jgi:predicted TIM-barrel fold metal-dependent hydrolase
MRNGHLVIDSDGHVIEPGDLWTRYMAPEFQGVAPTCSMDKVDIEVLGYKMSRSSANEEYAEFSRQDEERRFGAARARGYGAASHLDVMDSEGIDKMVLYPTRGLFAVAVADLDGRVSSAIARAYNRWIRDFCDTDPNRLVGVAMVGLHDPHLAVDEVSYAVEELGLSAVMTRPNPTNGRNLHDPAYDVFYARCAELGVPVAFHEGCGVWMPQYGVDRFSEHIAWHAMCHPMEQMGAVLSMTIGGVMERHPALQVAFLEAGSTWLPYWLYRLDEHVEWIGEVEARHLTMMPSEYFRRQGWISVESDEPNLRTVIDAVGIDRLLWASDYPHPDAKFPGCVEEIFGVKDLTDDDRRKLLCDNPANFYNLAVVAPASV